jgi:hypothetical protein
MDSTRGDAGTRCGAQELRLLWPRTRPCHAQRRLLRWFTEIADHEVPELLRLARTIDAWSEELLA